MRTLPLLVIAFALAAGCATREAPASTSGDQVVEPVPGVLIVQREAAPERAPYEFTTAILENGSYQHPRLDADVEATIIWWNTDNDVHSVVSDDGQFAGSGPISPNSEFSYTFLTAGDYAYHCRYHPDMKGIVVVR